MISHFCREVDENYALLGYYAASSGNFLPAFRNKLSVPSSGFKNPKGILLFGKVHTTSKLHLRLYFCTTFRRKLLSPFRGEWTVRSGCWTHTVEVNYWLYRMVCCRLACHSYETGKTRKEDHHCINDYSENTGDLGTVYFVLLITENMEIVATSLSDIRSRNSNEVLGEYLPLQKASGIQQPCVSVRILQTVQTFTSMNKMHSNTILRNSVASVIRMKSTTQAM